VLPKIRQDVNEGVPHLARRLERASVPAIAPDRAAALEPSIHALGDADRETACAARERAPVVRFGDEVQVVALNRKMDDTERVARSIPYRIAN
jgi:hypothetical protein